MDALVKYCQTHEKDERNPYRHHLLAYLGDMTTEGFDRAIYFWKKDREDYIILKTLYRIFTPAERTEFHRLFPTVCEWLNEQLKKHNEADLKTMAVAQS